MYCVLAVYRSLYDYFFDEKLSFEELEKMARAEKGKAVWHLLLDIELAKRGIEIVTVEKTDYQKLFEGKEVYIKSLYNKQTVEYYLTKSNVVKLFDVIPQYLKLVSNIKRQPTTRDVDNFLNKGCIIGAEINSRILNKRPGFALHYVLIHKKVGDSYFMHDPGLPPVENRKVSKSDLEKSFANEVTGFKIRQNKS